MVKTSKKIAVKLSSNDLYSSSWWKNSIRLGACAILGLTMSILGPLDGILLAYNTKISASVQQENLEAHTAKSTANLLQQHQQQQQPTLPRCEDLMNRHDFLRDGAFLSRQDTEVAWPFRPDGSRELILPHTCVLKRYTAREARQCLAHKHVLTIGDSLTRYQTLGLMYFLERGRHPAGFPRPNPGQNCTHFDEHDQPQCGGIRDGDDKDEKNVCREQEHGGWINFHRYVGDKSGPFRGHLECSCSRAVGPQLDVETLIYRNYNISVSHLSEVGWNQQPTPLGAFDLTGCAETGSCTLSNMEIEARLNRSKFDDFDYKITLTDPTYGGFDKLKQLLGAIDITLYNRGNWNSMSAPMAKDLMPQFRELATDRCFYKSTTQSPRTRSRPYMRPLIEMDRVFEETKTAGCEYMDYAHVTSAFEHFVLNRDPEFLNDFWDVVHYQPWVYEELNNLLLNVLCNTK